MQQASPRKGRLGMEKKLESEFKNRTSESCGSCGTYNQKKRRGFWGKIKTAGPLQALENRLPKFGSSR